MFGSTLSVQNIEKEYVSKIKEAGIKEAGFLKELDEAETKKGGKLCLGLECLDRDLWDFDRAFQLIRKTGVKRVRIQSGWQKTEKEKGVYDFGWLDNVVDKLCAAEIEPFLSLSYGNKLYCSDFEKCPNVENGGVGHIPVDTEEERDGWKNYVREAVFVISETGFRTMKYGTNLTAQPLTVLICSGIMRMLSLLK